MKSLDQVCADISRVLEEIEDSLPRAGSLERLLLPSEVAELLRVEVATLEAWRSNGQGPLFVKLGRRDVRYRPSDVLKWLDERICKSTWDASQRT